MPEEENNGLPEAKGLPAEEVVATEETVDAEKVAAEEAAACAETCAQPEEEIPSSVELRVEKVDFDGFRSVLAGYYDGLLKLIRITKAKDETIAKLTGELQMYREDFSLKLVKPFCVALIALREDYRKTLREIDSYAKTKEDVIKYSDYVLSDLEDLLLNQNIELNGGMFYIGGEPLFDKKPRKASFEKPAINPPAEKTAESASAAYGDERSFDGLLRYIDARNKEITDLLADNCAADANLLCFCNAAAALDDNYADAVLLPLYKSAAALYSKTEGLCAELKENITEENKVGSYATVLQTATEGIDKILLSSGVTVVTELGDTFDSSRDKLLKVVPCEDETKDRKIAKRHSDCYLFAGKLLYPSKVDVYKFTK